ncbi:MAG: universal stress protein [Terracidiphilus sp.]|jgi:nucleotide-binding universal stress UspA family protein
MPITGDRPDLNLQAVVYATDFSLCSQNAGLYAARLAAYFSAKLLVTHVFTLSQAALEVEVGDRRSSQQRKDLLRLLSGRAELLGGDSMKAIPTLLEGDPEVAIPELADKNQPSLIVLGTHGGGKLERGIIGSVAEKILRSTRWPALTVGPQVQPVSAKTLPFERILFATDFTPAAANAATYAVTLAEVFGAGIDVLNAIEDEAIAHPDLLSDLQGRFFSALDGLVPEQAKKFCDPRTFVAVGDARKRILEHIEERAIDLLVLGIRKTSHLGMEMRTSRAFQIIVDATCPVLTIRS